MKIIILLILSFFVSGCSVDYHLTIDENSRFLEDVLIKSETKEESDLLQKNNWPLKVYYTDPDLGDNPEKIEGVSYYADTTFLEGNYYQRRMTFEYPKSKFSIANLIRSCYDKFYVMEDDNEKSITLSTSSQFICMEEYDRLDQVHIFAEVKNPVISHNATSVNGNVYEWVIDRDHYDNSGIILTYSSKPIKKIEKEDIGEKVWLAFVLLGGFLIFIIGVIVFNVKKQNS